MLSYLLIFILTFFIKLNSFFYFQNSIRPFTIMINPAGDAKDAGRVLNDSFERGITLQFAQELKKELEKNFKNIRVVLTRIPGESLEHLQNANFSNRLDADFYFSVHFYKEKETISKLYLFHYLNDSFSSQSISPLNFYQYDNAHLLNISKTLQYINDFKKTLSNKIDKFIFKNYYGIPFKPLIGIKAPAIAMEAGLKNSNDWQNLIIPIIEAFRLIIP